MYRFCSNFQKWSTHLFHKLVKARVNERKRAIAEGKMDDPLVPKRLEDAITIVGTCLDMCPRFERYRRERENNLFEWESVCNLSFLFVIKKSPWYPSRFLEPNGLITIAPWKCMSVLQATKPYRRTYDPLTFSKLANNLRLTALGAHCLHLANTGLPLPWPTSSRWTCSNMQFHSWPF